MRRNQLVDIEKNIWRSLKKILVKADIKIDNFCNHKETKITILKPL